MFRLVGALLVFCGVVGFFSAVEVFVVGLVLGLIMLQKWAM